MNMKSVSKSVLRPLGNFHLGDQSLGENKICTFFGTISPQCHHIYYTVYLRPVDIILIEQGNIHDIISCSEHLGMV